MRHPNYQGPKFEENNLITSSSKKLTAFKEYTYHGSEEDDRNSNLDKQKEKVNFRFIASPGLRIIVGVSLFYLSTSDTRGVNLPLS